MEHMVLARTEAIKESHVAGFSVNKEDKKQEILSLDPAL
jgi:hypothetical protein